LFEAKRTNGGGERCAIGFGVMEQIEKYFVVNRVTPRQVLNFLA
jgi:hypothetical protein